MANSHADLVTQDILTYCERLETTLRQETDRLSEELRDTRFDLEDARQSRRGFQQEMQDLRSRVGWLSQENDNLKVTGELRACVPLRRVADGDNRIATHMSYC